MRTSTLVVNRPIYLQVRDNLIERIGIGEWKVGAQTPNEADLAREYGVSSGTMRRALDQLEKEQVIRRKQGRGTFVVSRHPAKICPVCQRPIGENGGVA